MKRMTDKMRRTPFGTMLNNFRYQKELLISKAVNAMLEKNKAKGKYGSLEEGYEVRESQIQAQDGSVVVRVELWKKLDTERVKITTSVNAEIVKDDPVPQEEESWL